MYRTISNEFAQLYSWEGAKGKKKFGTLKLSEVIFGKSWKFGTSD